MEPSPTSTSVPPRSDEIETRRPWDTDQHAARGTRSPSPPRSLGLPLPASSSIPTLRLGRTPKTRRDRAISNEGIGGSQPPGTLNRWSRPPQAPQSLPPRTRSSLDGPGIPVHARHAARGLPHHRGLSVSHCSRRAPPRPILSFSQFCFRASGRTNSRLPTIFRL